MFVKLTNVKKQGRNKFTLTCTPSPDHHQLQLPAIHAKPLLVLKLLLADGVDVVPGGLAGEAGVPVPGAALLPHVAVLQAQQVVGEAARLVVLVQLLLLPTARQLLLMLLGPPAIRISSGMPLLNKEQMIRSYISTFL
jgi:hypothetical protein